MAPKYKVSYFNFTGLGEPIRFLLSYLGEDFEDVRFEQEEWMNKVKATTPFGKCPVLTVDGKDLTQSKAISRYLGNKAGLGGKDDWENLQIDIIVDAIDDFLEDLSKYFWEENETVKEKLKGPLYSETVPLYMKKFDAIIKDNKGFLANGKLSWADLWFTAVSDYMSGTYGSNIAANYPNVKALFVQVASIPKIKAWLEKRPNTDL